MDKSHFKNIYVILFFALLIVSSSIVLSAYLNVWTSELWSAFWLMVTHLGDTLGVVVLLIILSFIVVFSIKGVKKKVTTGILLFLFVGSILASLAVFNVFVFKERLKTHRPSIQYLQQHMNLDADAMYELDSKKQRRIYMDVFFEQNYTKDVVFEGKYICTGVIKLWKYETGYSFPSGHSVNSFLLALLASYLMLWFYPDKYLRKVVVIYSVAVLIALSRVLLGVHTPYDITMGAIWGSVVGWVLIRTGLFKYVVFNISNRVE